MVALLQYNPNYATARLHHGSHPGASSMKCHQLVCLNTGYVCSRLPNACQNTCFLSSQQMPNVLKQGFYMKVYSAELELPAVFEEFSWSLWKFLKLNCLEIKSIHHGLAEKNMPLTIPHLNFNPLRYYKGHFYTLMVKKKLHTNVHS